jgi:hypothetical protein
MPYTNIKALLFLGLFKDKNYGVFGLCPLSGILKPRERSVLETGFVSVLRWKRKAHTLLGPLESANLKHWTWTKSKNLVILSVIHHSQHTLESTV